MPKYIDSRLKRINVDSYSQSGGFIGFFERSVHYKNGLEEIASSYFINCFLPLFHNGYVISSLYMTNEFIRTYLPNKLRKITLWYSDYLLSKKLIHIFDDNCSTSEIDKAADDLSALKKYQVIELSKFSLIDISAISLVPMSVSGIFGHLLFYFPKYELIVYPHDDTGFGVIDVSSPPNINNYFAVNFLKGANNLNGFVYNLKFDSYPSV